jgi:hypothetical protein
MNDLIKNIVKRTTASTHRRQRLWRVNSGSEILMNFAENKK